MTEKQFTEKLYSQYRSPEEAAIALTATLKFYQNGKQQLDDMLVGACIEGGKTMVKWEQENDRFTNHIEETERKLEELQAYIAVGYPQCMYTNASSVLDVYKEKMETYRAK